MLGRALYRRLLNSVGLGRFGTPQLSRSTIIMSSDSRRSLYQQWEKDGLINRIIQLEQQLGQRGTEHGMTPNSASSSPAPPKAKRKKEMDFSKFATRKVAIRFAYLGWNYNGLAIQTDDNVPTVEMEIVKALHRTKVIASIDVSECEFSRCGRTDKGVSAMRQVISLRVRSALTGEEQLDPANDAKELDYLRMLNNLLPKDIIAYEISLRPPEGFDARFSCTFRHYRYYFQSQQAQDLCLVSSQMKQPCPDLDVPLMQEAAKLFLGSHDFRNFCKIDASKQITNYVREVLDISIEPVQGMPGLWFLNLKGTAFLWHQVRSMMAILLVIGQKLETPDIISQMLDVEEMPGRPVYEMAADFPLVLYDCGFPEMEWKSFQTSEGHAKAVTSSFNLWHEYWLKSVMAQTLKEGVFEYGHRLSDSPERTRINIGKGYGKPVHRYRRLSEREILDTPEVVNRRWREKKAEKLAAKRKEH